MEDLGLIGGKKTYGPPLQTEAELLVELQGPGEPLCIKIGGTGAHFFSAPFAPKSSILSNHST